MHSNERKKQISMEYKDRQIVGGVYAIKNTVNGKYFISSACNISSPKNQFQFAVKTDSCVKPLLSDDWNNYGSQSFIFEVLEELEKKAGQTQKEFLKDLKTLEEMWYEKMNSSLSYKK